MENIKIKKFNPVYLEEFHLDQDVCAICREDILNLCVICQSYKTETECAEAIGKCGHVFHLHCIASWLDNVPKCPLDNRQWSYSTL